MVSGNSTCSSALVLQPPTFLRWILAAIGIAGLGYLICTRPAGFAEIGDDHFAVLACLGVLIGPLGFLLRQRVELDENEIREFSGSRLVRRCACRDIERIHIRAGRKVLVFKNGQRIVVNDAWPGAQEAVVMFQTLIDARQ